MLAADRVIRQEVGGLTTISLDTKVAKIKELITYIMWWSIGASDQWRTIEKTESSALRVMITIPKHSLKMSEGRTHWSRLPYMVSR